MTVRMLTGLLPVFCLGSCFNCCWVIVGFYNAQEGHGAAAAAVVLNLKAKAAAAEHQRLEHGKG